MQRVAERAEQLTPIHLVAIQTLLGRAQDLILPIAMIASVLVIMVPLPAALMDVLLAANITIAVLILLTTIYVRQPLEFSVFPSMLARVRISRVVATLSTSRASVVASSSDGKMLKSSGVRT